CAGEGGGKQRLTWQAAVAGAALLRWRSCVAIMPIMPVILSSHRIGGGRSSPRVGIAQGTDLGAVVTYLVERGGDEARGGVRGTGRAGNAQAASRRLRGVRVPGGRHFELVVVGSLDRLPQSLPAVAQLADSLGGAGEDRVMGQVGGRPAAGH